MLGYIGHQLELSDSKLLPTGSFRIPYSPKKSKTLDFFDELYTNPPKFRIKWEMIDELHDDLFMSYNYRVLDRPFSFMDMVTKFASYEEGEPTSKVEYSLSSYIDGYFNKLVSTRFYEKSTRTLQERLQTVPIYVILNGQGEIVLATSTDSSVSTSSALNDLCGTIDPLVENSRQLGLFFLSKKDAEVYRDAIAQSDTSGTKMFGLSIHCFGLDFAYRVTREHHPNIDFRFIPDLEELQSVMTARTTGNSSLVFEDGQQQLRFRRRTLNVLPLLGNITKWASPFSSFLEKSEYFKGVPIYIVNVNENPNNFFVARYYNFLNVIDKSYLRLVNFVNFGLGFGNNWILQGSVQQSLNPTNKSYVFLEKSAALDFCQSYGRKVARYNSTRGQLLDPFPKKAKILVHNLEDFLEICEESTLSQPTNVVGKDHITIPNISFIPSKQAGRELTEYTEQNKKSIQVRCKQFIDFKYRRLVGFFEILLNTN